MPGWQWSILSWMEEEKKSSMRVENSANCCTAKHPQNETLLPAADLAT